MVSILIPYYNWDIGPLIEDLYMAAQHFDGKVEIVTCDDCSTQVPKQLEAISQKNVALRMLRNEVNRGRSATRNRLVSEASCDTIIFIDGDSRLSKPETYIKNYLEAIKIEDVVIGGTAYDAQPPKDSNLRLHWHYGRSREAKPAHERMKTPERYFFTNNFCCRRSLITATRFDESIQGYGYEDSEWAQRLLKMGIKIHHIENNVIHKGLKNSEKFLQDADSGVQTLAQWRIDEKSSSIRLLEYYRKSEKESLPKILVYLAHLTQPLLRKLLVANITTNLKIYDLYRLGKLRATLSTI